MSLPGERPDFGSDLALPPFGGEVIAFPMAPVSEEAGVAVCGLEGFCLANMRDLSPQLEDAQDDFEVVVEYLDAWHMLGAGHFAHMARAREQWAASITENVGIRLSRPEEVGKAKDMYEPNDRNFATHVVRGRQLALDTLDKELGASWDKEIAVATTREALDAHDRKVGTLKKRVIMSEDPADPTKPSPKLQRIFENMFLEEQTVRVQLAAFVLEHPDVARKLFDPKALTSYGESVKRFVALDLVRGKGSSIVLNLFGESAGQTATNHSFPDQFSEYMANEDTTPEAGELLRAIAYGAKLTGAPVCSANIFGLCRDTIEGFEEGDMPQKVVADMARKLRRTNEGAVKGLATFAQKYPVPKVLQVGLKIDPPVARTAQHSPQISGNANRKGTARRIAVQQEMVLGGPQQRRRGYTLTAADVQLGSGERKSQPVEPSFNRVVVRGRSGEELAIATDAESEELEQFYAALLGFREIRNFCQKYNCEDARDFLQSCMTRILFSPTYAEQNAPIRPLYVVHRGGSDRARRMRLSGRYMNTATTKLARQTRILFTQRTEDHTRYVDLAAVRHKTEVEKEDYGRFI